MSGQEECLVTLKTLQTKSFMWCLGSFWKTTYKEGSLESKNWPPVLSGYTMSKTALNSYTRMLAKKFPRFRINCLCPGFVKTDINHYVGFLTIDEGAECPARLALLPDNGPSGLFFLREEVLSFVWTTLIATLMFPLMLYVFLVLANFLSVILWIICRHT